MDSAEELKGMRGESIDIYLLANEYLLWVGHAINKNVLEYTTDYVQSYKPFIRLEGIDTEQNKEKIASVFLDILILLKKITSS